MDEIMKKKIQISFPGDKVFACFPVFNKTHTYVYIHVLLL